MTLGKYLLLVLGADAKVCALVGERIFSEVLPDRPTLPALVFNEIGGNEDQLLEGASGVGARRVQIDSWAESRDEATALGNAVRAVLNGHSGAAAGFEVQGVFLEAERWDVDSTDVPGAVLYRTIQEYDATISGVQS